MIRAKLLGPSACLPEFHVMMKRLSCLNVAEDNRHTANVAVLMYLYIIDHMNATLNRKSSSPSNEETVWMNLVSRTFLIST